MHEVHHVWQAASRETSLSRLRLANSSPGSAGFQAQHAWKIASTRQTGKLEQNRRFELGFGVQRIEARGIRIVTEPFVPSATSCKLAFFAAPFGDLIELVEVLP